MEIKLSTSEIKLNDNLSIESFRRVGDNERYQPTVHKIINGKQQAWNVVTRKSQPKFVTGEYTPDAVVIAATCDGKLLVIREFRQSIQNYEYGLPAGMIEKGLSIQQTAIKELFEETGMNANENDISYISPILYSSVGLTDETKVVVHLKATGIPSNEHLEGNEQIEAMLLSQADAIELINKQLENGEGFGATGFDIIRLFAYTGVTNVAELVNKIPRAFS
jgi:ADP-ribose pyrophosphatase